MLQRLLALTARNAVFGLFAVADNSRKIANSTDDHYFELRHVEGGTAEILSGPRGASLHELL